MVQRRFTFKFLDHLIIFPIFFTPLLFFTHSHDQFELPKLTYLMLLTLPGAILAFKNKVFSLPTPLTLSLYFLAFVQILASLPETSLSWRASLLGDYENFSGLTTLFTYLILFQIFSLYLTEEKIEKIFYFNSLAAIFSSFYAVGQHFKFDFIQWNPESLNSAREFAALGNPNFLSAYLAMSIPLFLSHSLKAGAAGSKSPPFPGIPFWFLASLGFLFLFLGTDHGFELFHLAPSAFSNLIFRIIGLILFSIACVRWILYRHWITTLCGLTILGLGLFSTGSRGGFLGALFGLGLWIWLILRKSEFSNPVRQFFSNIPRGFLIFSSFFAAALLFFIGHGFLNRLADSLVHMGNSLATSRLHIWRPALRIIESNPFLGVGLDNFKIAFPYYSGIEFNKIDGMFMSSRMAHNELLQMASTTGLLGLGAYLGVLAAFGFQWWKTFRVSGPSVQWWLIAVLAGAVAYHVQNFFSFGVVSINLVWFLLLAIVQSQYRKTLGPSIPQTSGLRLYGAGKKAALALFFLFGLFFPLSRLGADIAFGKSSAASDILKNPDPQMSNSDLISYSDYEIEHLKKAVELCPLEVKYRLYLGLAYEQRSQLDAARSRDWSLMALQCYGQSIEMSPANAYYYNNEGRVDDALSRSDPQYLSQAEQAYQKAVHWDPSSPLFIVNWATALEKLGKEKEFESELQQAFQLDPSFTSKILAQLAFDRYHSGEKQKAFQFLDEAVKGNTSSAEVYYCRGILDLSEKKKKQALEDFEAVKSLHPTPEKNPSIQSLDEFIDQAKE